MPRSALALVTVLLLVGGGAYFLLRDPATAGGGADVGRTSIPDAAMAPAPIERGASGGGAVAPVPTTAFQDRADPEVAAAEGFVVMVVDEADRPVAAARVEARPEGRRAAFDPSGFEVGAGPLATVVSDAAGRAAFGFPLRRGLDLVGRAPKRAGRLVVDPAAIDAAATPPKLVLRPVKTVEVKVVDPSDVPVAGVRVQAAGEGFMPARESAISADPDGAATFEITALDEILYDAEEVSVSATLFGLPPVEAKARFEGGVARAVLRTPAVVVVRVNVSPAAGDAPPPRLSLDWRVQNTGGRRGPDFGGGMFNRRSFEGLTTLVGAFPPSATVAFTLSAERRTTTEASVTLPASGRAEVEIPLGGLRPMLAVRVVDDVGRPVADATFGTSVQQEAGAAPAAPAAEDGGPFRRASGAARSTDRRTDDAGVLRVPVVAGSAGTLVVRPPRPRGFRPPSRTEEPALGERAFPALEAGAEFAVEDVVAPRKPVLAAGRVVDPRGAPVKRASVALAAKPPAPNAGPGAFAPMSNRFADLLDVAVRTDDQGAFEIRADLGDVDPATLVLSATAGDGKSEDAPLEVGRTDVVLKLIAYGGLRGSMKPASPDLKGTWTIRARDRGRPSGPAFGFDRRGSVRPRGAEGAFEIKSLLPGRYDVLVRYDEQDALTIADVEVRSGEVTDDPRLRGLVVGGAFMTAAVLVLDAEGAPLPGASVTFRPSGGAAAATPPGPFGSGFSIRSATTDPAGRASQVFADPPAKIAVTVTARDHAPKTIEDAAFPLTVKLSRGATVLVAFEGAGGLPRIDGVEAWRLRLARAQPAGTPQQPPNPFAGFGGRNGPPSVRLEPGATEATVKGLEAGSWTIRLEAVAASVRREGAAEGQPEFLTAFGGGGADVGAVVVPPEEGTVRAAVKLDEAVLASLRALAPRR